MELRPVEGRKHLYRDMETGAILNMNSEVAVGKKNSQRKKTKTKRTIRKEY